MKKIILIVLTTFLSTTSYAGFTVNDLENGCKNYGPRGSSVTPNISDNME
ncbi:hypothetical protein MTZ49_13945 [Entomomonas sp. E2T0]|nr:hypothetical protein [Entomomonas sp. E2T0]UYZ83682.1 hypothetical protein MTZ49_13945 [Entomomonas sp. E2T0]